MLCIYYIVSVRLFYLVCVCSIHSSHPIRRDRGSGVTKCDSSINPFGFKMVCRVSSYNFISPTNLLIVMHKTKGWANYTSWHYHISKLLLISSCIDYHVPSRYITQLWALWAYLLPIPSALSYSSRGVFFSFTCLDWCKVFPYNSKVLYFVWVTHLPRSSLPMKIYSSNL